MYFSVIFGNSSSIFSPFFYRIFLKHFISCAFLFRAFFGVGDVHHTHTNTLQLCRLPPVSPFSLVVPRCSLLCVVKWNVKQEKGAREEEDRRQAGGRRTTPNATSSSRLHSALRWAGGKGLRGRKGGNSFSQLLPTFWACIFCRCCCCCFWDIYLRRCCRCHRCCRCCCTHFRPHFELSLLALAENELQQKERGRERGRGTAQLSRQQTTKGKWQQQPQQQQQQQQEKQQQQQQMLLLLLQLQQAMRLLGNRTHMSCKLLPRVALVAALLRC